MFTWADFVAGYLSGIVALLISHPFDTVKVREQNFNTPLVRTVVNTFVYEGWRGFYKGMSLPISTVGPTNSIFFGVYGNSLHILQSSNATNRLNIQDPNWKVKAFTAGSIAATVQVLITCPIDLVKIVLQSSTDHKWAHDAVKYNGMRDCLTKIYQQGGILMLYRGIIPMMYRDIWSSGLYMLSYEYLLKTPPYKCNEVMKQIIAGGFAGVLSWVFVMPFDVCKSRLQGDNLTMPVYKGMTDCFIKSYKHDGYRVFLKGGTMIICRAWVSNCALFIVYEATMKLIAKEDAK